MVLSAADFRDKVLACWLGKNIGGTLGAPFEWRRQVNHVEFYTQDLGGEPLPNDDLDIQLLWLIALEEKGLDLDSHLLADWWLTYVTPHWAEYGNAKMNLRAGLAPPLSGSLNNVYKHSCGAFIRSEIWACIAPGMPEAAASYALQDSILDHGDGEGTHAAVFCAALESLAFVESDLRQLIDSALTFIPSECGVAKAVHLASALFEEGVPLLDARDEILRQYRGKAFMGADWAISELDKRKGFYEGELGWDVPSNIGILILALLYGEGEFGRTICSAVNCGEDTDCTAATLGALFGIMRGTDGIPQKWIEPIGRGIKTACLNLGELGVYGDRVPQDVDSLTDRTCRVSRLLLQRYGNLLSDGGVQLSDGSLDASPQFHQKVAQALAGPTYKRGRFLARVQYGADGPFLQDEAVVKVTVENCGPVQTQLFAQVLSGEDLHGVVSPGVAPCFPPHLGGPAVFEVMVKRMHQAAGAHRCSLQLVIPGWPDAILVPITLLPG